MSWLPETVFESIWGVIQCCHHTCVDCLEGWERCKRSSWPIGRAREVSAAGVGKSWSSPRMKRNDEMFLGVRHFRTRAKASFSLKRFCRCEKAGCDSYDVPHQDAKSMHFMTIPKINVSQSYYHRRPPNLLGEVSTTPPLVPPTSN